MLHHGPFSTDFYRQLHVVLHKEFRMRRGWEELRRGVRQPARLRRRHLRRLGAAAYHLATLPLERRKLERLAELPPQASRPLVAGTR
jgi:hypothetical protein